CVYSAALYCIILFFFYSYTDSSDLHSFPTRRSSDLGRGGAVHSGEDLTGGVENRHRHRDDAVVELVLHGGIPLFAHGVEETAQRGFRRDSLVRTRNELRLAKVLVERFLRLKRKQHAPEGGGVGGK